MSSLAASVFRSNSSSSNVQSAKDSTANLAVVVKRKRVDSKKDKKSKKKQKKKKRKEKEKVKVKEKEDEKATQVDSGPTSGGLGLLAAYGSDSD